MTRIAAVLAYLWAAYLLEIARALRASSITIGREAVELRGLAFDLRDMLHSKT